MAAEEVFDVVVRQLAASNSCEEFTSR